MNDQEKEKVFKDLVSMENNPANLPFLHNEKSYFEKLFEDILNSIGEYLKSNFNFKLNSNEALLFEDFFTFIQYFIYTSLILVLIFILYKFFVYLNNKSNDELPISNNFIVSDPIKESNEKLKYYLDAGLLKFAMRMRWKIFVSKYTSGMTVYEYLTKSSPVKPWDKNTDKKYDWIYAHMFSDLETTVAEYNAFDNFITPLEKGNSNE